VNADAGSGTVTGANGNPEIIDVALGNDRLPGFSVPPAHIRAGLGSAAESGADYVVLDYGTYTYDP
jgi:hypothetical protein